MELKTKTLNETLPGPEGAIGDNAAEEQKEIEALLREVAAKGLQKAAKIKANEALMELLEEDPGQETKAQRAEPERHSDTANLSNESRAYVRGAKDEASRQKELEILLEEVWKLLEVWQPQPEAGLGQEIKELGDIYRKLIEEIMRLYTQSQAGAQADRVNGLLLEIIDRLSSAKFPNLFQLMEGYGEQGADDSLRAALLQKITGKAISPQEVAAARQQQKLQGSQKTGAPLPGKGSRPAAAVREDGVLYNRGKGKRVNTNERYRESVRAVEQFRLHTSGGRRKTDTAPGSLGFQNKVYTIQDIQQTERFLSYISRDGNLFSNPEITAQNEELLGFLLAVSMTKLQIFTNYSGIEKGLAADIQGALERLFRYYLNRSIETSPYQDSECGVKPDGKAIQQMYYRVMELIHHLEKPETGIKKGLQYAWEIFISKKEREEYKRYKRYHRNAGFFTSHLEDKDKIKEMNYGAGILDRDWKEFLDSIGQNQNSYLHLMLSNTPWGVLLEPEKDSGSKREGPPLFIFLAAAGACLLLAVAGVFLKNWFF